MIRTSDEDIAGHVRNHLVTTFDPWRILVVQQDRPERDALRISATLLGGTGERIGEGRMLTHAVVLRGLSPDDPERDYEYKAGKGKAEAAVALARFFISELCRAYVHPPSKEAA